MPPFRDDQILIISPGSQTTLAQLGLPESFTPARYRLRSRMFAAEKRGEYEAVKIRRKEKSKESKPETDGEGTDGVEQSEQKQEDDENEWEEDRVSEEGAIWPMQSGRIADWPCFYALMEHVYNTVNPPFHTPVLLIAQPVWTLKDHERVTQFFFEKFKVPAFGLMDSAMATSYAYGLSNATVVDVGYQKADITCISEFMLQNVGRGLAVPDCGGEAMTQRLVQLLSGRKGFSRDVCEQLKKSPVCEILPPDVEMPGDEPASAGGADNPAAAASTGADGAVPGQRKGSGLDLPRGPGPNTEVGEEKKLEDDEGVLDIASIVTGGNMSEYLAQKEREKQEKAVAKQQQKKGSDAQQQAAARPPRLPNHKRTRNTFIYEDFALHDAMKKAGVTSQGMTEMQSALGDGPNKRQKTPEPQSAVSEKPADDAFDGVVDKGPSGGFRREIEVGTERFKAADGGILDRLADAIHRTIQACGDVNKRGDLWDSLIILGNGSRVRGFQEALLDTLNKKYIISPSSATIFTSELPSNLSTPMATGANTPQPQMPGQQQSHHGGVNPLLLAATTAQNPQLHPSGSVMGQSTHGQHMHSSHAQTPTSIKLAKIPEYFPEWKEVGYDEASFLGAQVAAKVLFIVDGGQSNGYMTRTGYNEQGPNGIHECML
ncbi:Actin-like protein arp9 (SWI/SNF complex component arp9) [Saxophila tyrrhenica]|uniref:Actin-like protein arp9 (SWI/SNF complex component arp9) n=1 Tax=Saxophila tyrrhenica TaxID=1690608 RepID=A0AAV9PCA3_9PEZI|nr:Actin-like protein arp9 (SWI/SNF complex component arp9) [Saxophila tyrrhenica]